MDSNQQGASRNKGKVKIEEYDDARVPSSNENALEPFVQGLLGRNHSSGVVIPKEVPDTCPSGDKKSSKKEHVAQSTSKKSGRGSRVDVMECNKTARQLIGGKHQKGSSKKEHVAQSTSKKSGRGKSSSSVVDILECNKTAKLMIGGKRKKLDLGESSEALNIELIKKLEKKVKAELEIMAKSQKEEKRLVAALKEQMKIQAHAEIRLGKHNGAIELERRRQAMAAQETNEDRKGKRPMIETVTLSSESDE